MSGKRHYVTTAIDYPNAPPHMGHVLEKVLADVAVRWMRLRGDHVRFQIGTDEHGIKIQQTAAKEGMEPRRLVDRNVPLFQALYDALGISYDVFIRTTDQKRHWPTVTALWRTLQEAGALEKRTYTGLYCTGCERFLTKKDLVDGKCPIHLTAPEGVEEENWFFLLAREATWLRRLLLEEYRIVPEFRAPETFALIDQGLEDVSFSRPTSSLSWGVPVPGDARQTMYVWCDALTNYISGIGLLTPRAEPEWWDDATVTHVIGKDIARFHALIWPAMLKHAGIRPPDRLLIHGFLTSEGQKMSKSIGNVVVPQDVIGKYGVEPLRFYLSHEIPVGNDGDFSWKRFGELYDSKLRNQLGNLLNRILVLVRKDGGAVAVPPEPLLVGNHWTLYETHMNAFDFSAAIAQAFLFVAECNKFMDDHKPWTLAGKEKADALGALAESLRHIALMLLPFMPETASSIGRQLGVPGVDRWTDRSFVCSAEHRRWGSEKGWKSVGEPAILFAPVE